MRLKVSNSILSHRSLHSFWTPRRYARALSDPENKGRRQEHVNFDTIGTWDNRIELPLLIQESIKHGKPIPKISLENIGIATNLGRRTTNEDRFKVGELAPNLLYLSVYDGHGGAASADYCSLHMQDHISFWLNRGETDLENILHTSFLELNNAFAKYVTFNMGPGSDDASSGTTATVCLLRNSVQLVVGHVGDSRALLCRNGEPIALTANHTPSLKPEKERIKKSGGVVAPNSLGQILVNNRLAMTRSLGDLELKRYGVIPLPDTRSLEIKHGRDAFLILTTDGISGVMNDQEVCDTVNRCHEPKEAATFIVDQALQYASDDNSTALVIPFGSWGKFRTSSTAHYSFGRNMITCIRYM